LREVESAAQLQQPRPSLMERAGLAAAKLAQSLLDERGRRVLVIAGPGNNGGDAFEAATHLKNAFLRVTLVFAGDLSHLPADAAAASRKWNACGGETITEIPQDQTWDLVIDGLFGIGLSRALEGRMAELVSRINGIRASTGCRVLALDVPSGLDSDTGAVRGVAVRASHTLTFIARKPGLLTLDGPDHCGQLECADIGLDPASLRAPEGELLDHTVRGRLPARPKNFHKGHAGNVVVIGGATGMVGAVLIAGRAALQTGAGKVFVGTLAADAPAIDLLQPELMFRSARNALKEDGVLLMGPGLGKDRAAATLLRDSIASSRTLVLDADALNLASEHPATRSSVHRREAATLMTPHPAEAARLLRTTTADVQQDRVAAALALADRYNSFVVLKGNGSVLAQPVVAGQETGQRWWINATGNSGMASAGMGDALGGLLASFLAQGMAPLHALQLAVWLHGAAADRLCDADSSGKGPLGMTASDVIAQSRLLLNNPQF
jgi:hydroxyethylthiazole kinase-like uncharacterized protein yjeF